MLYWKNGKYFFSKHQQKSGFKNRRGNTSANHYYSGRILYSHKRSGFITFLQIQKILAVAVNSEKKIELRVRKNSQRLIPLSKARK